MQVTRTTAVTFSLREVVAALKAAYPADIGVAAIAEDPAATNLTTRGSSLTLTTTRNA
jgi:hypothetical protein